MSQGYLIPGIDFPIHGEVDPEEECYPSESMSHREEEEARAEILDEDCDYRVEEALALHGEIPW